MSVYVEIFVLNILWEMKFTRTLKHGGITGTELNVSGLAHNKVC